MKILHPFYKPDDDADINALLGFGSSSTLPPEEKKEALNLENMGLDDALQALLERDLEETGQTVEAEESTQPEEPDGVDINALLAALGSDDDTQPLSGSVAETAPVAVDNEDDADAEIRRLLAMDEAESSTPDPTAAAASEAGGVDINALLAALGSDDDTQSISGSSPPPSSMLDSDDPDEQLRRLMELDEKGDSSLILPGGESVSRVVVSDTYDDTPAAPVAKKPKKKKLGQRLREMSVPTMLGTAAAVLLLILSLGLGGILTVRYVHAARLEQALIPPSRYIYLTLPENVTNDNFFIVLNETAHLGVHDFMLQRVTFGFRGTTFLFDTRFNPDDYTIVLFDQNGHLFPRVRHDVDNHILQRGTLLQFAPIHPHTRQLTLYIQRPGDAETAAFYFQLQEPVSLPRPVYVNHPTRVVESFYIENAVFSNTASEIVYVRRESPPEGERVIEREGSITLLDGSTWPTPHRAGAMEYYFSDYQLVLGRATFGPMRNLDSTARLAIRDVFDMRPAPPGNIDLAALFRNAPEYQQILTMADGSEIVLERMGIQGPFVILVFHGRTAGGRRIQTELDVELVARTPYGNIRVLGQNWSSPRGTDVLFDMTPHLDSLSGRALDYYQMDIRGIGMQVSETVYSLPIWEIQAHRPNAERIEAEDAVKSAFRGRLAYKSQQKDFSQIEGFSPAVLNNRAVMRHYSPIATLGESISKYDVRVIAGTFAAYCTFLAIVEEEWVLEYEGVFTTFHRTHQIVAENREGEWTVVSNYIL